jgi:hypothetical protein
MVYNARHVAETETRSTTERYRRMQSISSAGRRVRRHSSVGPVASSTVKGRSQRTRPHTSSKSQQRLRKTQRWKSYTPGSSALPFPFTSAAAQSRGDSGASSSGMLLGAMGTSMPSFSRPFTGRGYDESQPGRGAPLIPGAGCLGFAAQHKYRPQHVLENR